MEEERFIRLQYTCTILSINANSLFSAQQKLNGKIPCTCSILYLCFRSPITCSMWIHTNDKSQLQSTSTFSSYFFPLVNGCILISTKYIPTWSLQVTPLSFNTSPFKRKTDQITFYFIIIVIYLVEGNSQERVIPLLICLKFFLLHTWIHMISFPAE